MKYVYAVSKPDADAFTIKQANAVLPTNFTFQDDGDQLLLVVNQTDGLSDEQIFIRVQRECDRLFFLTAKQLDPKILLKVNDDGEVTGFKTFTIDAHIVKPLAPKIKRQQWHDSLPVQLRLWQLAQSPILPVATQINLLFQIIEISYPDTRDSNSYPQYTNVQSPPHPRTEAKLMRDLASHGKKQMNASQVKLYCQYLGISEESHDPTDLNFLKVLRDHLHIVKEEARKVIDDSITRKP